MKFEEIEDWESADDHDIECSRCDLPMSQGPAGAEWFVHLQDGRITGMTCPACNEEEKAS